MLKSLSIRYKLSGIIAISLLVSIVITTLISSNTMRDLVSSRITEQEIPLTLNNVAFGVAQQLQQPLVVSKSMANNTLISDELLSPERASTLVEYLKHTRENSNGIVAFYVDGESRNYYTDKGLARKISSSSSSDQWFYNFINSGKPYSLDIDVDAQANTLTLFINYRTHDKKSVAGIGMGMPELSQFIKQFKFGNNGYAFLTDAQGNITVHPDQAVSIGTKLSALHHEAANQLLDRSQVNLVTLKEQGIIIASKYIEELNWFAIIALPITEVYQPITNATFSLVVISLLIAAVLIGLGLSMVLAVSRPISDASKMLSDIASGDADLTKKLAVNSQDEVGQLSSSFNQFTCQLQDIVGGVISNAQHINQTSDQLSSSSNGTLVNIDEQQRSIDMIATATTEMAASIRELAHNAQETADAASNSIEESNTGKLVVSKTIEKINSVYGEVDTASHVIETLAQDIGEISGILSVITGISEQTNLLALNAAIEAARAGEQGRGFAVVADEVRTLAQRTQESTEQISNMIKKLQQGAEGAVNAMASGLDMAKDSVSSADEAGHSLENIIVGITTISDLGMQVAAATQEQASVVEELNSHIIDVKSVSDKTAEEAKNINHSCTELSSSTAQLNDLVSNFKV